MSLQYRNYREVASPLTDAMLSPLEPQCDRVQFSSILTDGEFRRLAEFMEAHPAVTLRAYGSRIDSLDFLGFFPRLRRFSIDAGYQLDSLVGLDHLSAELIELTVGDSLKNHSLAPLERFHSLNRLCIEGHTRDLDVVSSFTTVRSLTLRSVTLPDLKILSAFSDLRALDIKLGGTKNPEGIEAFRNLRYLELWMVKGFSQLETIARVPTLEFLFLQSLSGVKDIPDLSAMTNLRFIEMVGMKGISNLSPLLSASGLEQLALYEMPQLQPADVKVLAAHPRLENAAFGLSTKAKTDAVAAMLNLPRPTYRRREYVKSLLA